MAAQTGNSYISGTMTDSVDITTANSGFSTMMSSMKMHQSDWGSVGQPKVVRLALKTSILPFPVVRQCRIYLRTLSFSLWWPKTLLLPLYKNYFGDIRLYESTRA